MRTVLEFITKTHFLFVLGSALVSTLLVGIAAYQKTFERCTTGENIIHVFSQKWRLARAVEASGKLLICVSVVMLALSLLQRCL